MMRRMEGLVLVSVLTDLGMLSCLDFGILPLEVLHVLRLFAVVSSLWMGLLCWVCSFPLFLVVVVEGQHFLLQ